MRLSLLRILAAFFFLFAALLAFGTLRASISVEGLALAAFACWVVSDYK